MNDFFSYDTETLMDAFRNTREEVEETFYYEKNGTHPDDELHKAAIYLLGLAINYVRGFQSPTLDKVVDCLFIIREGEYRFLIGPEIFESSVLYEEFEERCLASKEAIPLAGKYLYYFSHFFMQQSDPAYGFEFDIKVKEFLKPERKTVKKEMKEKVEEKIPSKDKPESEEAKRKGPNKRFPLKLKTYMDKYMVGQDELKKILAMKTYHFLNDQEVKPMLMLGDTGSGKNYSIGILNRFLKDNKINVPVVSYDLSQLTPAGFTGDSMEQIRNLVDRTRLHRQSRKIILYLDEVCKLVRPSFDAEGSNVKLQCQGELLTFMAETEGIMIILGGAFEDLQAIRQKRANHHALGFNKNEETLDKRYSLRDDLISIGMSRELLGRIGSIVELDKFTRDDFKDILLRKEGPLEIRKAAFKKDNLYMIVDEDMPDKIVDKIIEQNLGARGVANIVEEICNESYNFDMLSRGDKYIRIHSGMLNGEPPIFMKRK